MWIVVPGGGDGDVTSRPALTLVDVHIGHAWSASTCGAARVRVEDRELAGAVTNRDPCRTRRGRRHAHRRPWSVV